MCPCGKEEVQAVTEVLERGLWFRHPLVDPEGVHRKQAQMFEREWAATTPCS